MGVTAKEDNDEVGDEENDEVLNKPSLFRL